MQFAIGNQVRHKGNGVGLVEQVDPGNKDFAVLVRFKNKTLAWVPEKSLQMVEPTPED